ncbi:MAG TPA: hypothetical protein VMX55_08590 [candidate division Zixibacteria bacterium]|nr:hypothetical protein [candidate division Zixibacteria bacterium]
MIPDWVVVKQISEVSIPRDYFKIDLEEWPKIARERINKFIQGARWFPSRSVSRGNYAREIYEELAGHGLLRLAAADNNRIFGWLIEQEGDLFEWRFNNTKTIHEKIDIAKYFFGEDKVIDPQDLWSKFNINEKYFKDFKMGNKRTGVIGIHFTCVPKLISNRSALVRDGWVLNAVNDFSNSVKIAFELRLKERIRESGERMDRTARGVVKEVQDELGKLIHSIATSSGKIDLEDYKLYRRQDIFPQCMLDLYNEVMGKGHIGHQERFQLGLYLKRLGMTIDEQLHFWYSSAVDNVGLTFNQFINGNAGYIIRHMYGLEGGETDYDAPSCETLQNQGYYCTFLHQSVEEIDKHLRKEFKNPTKKIEESIRMLESKVIDKKPSEACAILFNLRYNRFSRPVNHPLNYSEYAAKCKKIIELPKQEDSEKKNQTQKKEE